MAIQVPAAPARKIRRYVKPVGVPRGVRHRYHSSRWKHRCDGDIFSCRLVWACPDLAHEPRPRVNLLLGRALRMICCELRQRLPATRCGGPPPRSEAGARGDSPDVHLPLHQGARYLAFPMLPSSRPSAREYVMRKCWRSWPRMTWILSPHSSLWPTSAPEPPRAVHSTRPHKPGLPSRMARVSSRGTVRGKRRRTATTRSHGPPL
jgi:hypothetical protein